MGCWTVVFRQQKSSKGFSPTSFPQYLVRLYSPLVERGTVRMKCRSQKHNIRTIDRFNSHDPRISCLMQLPAAHFQNRTLHIRIPKTVKRDNSWTKEDVEIFLPAGVYRYMLLWYDPMRKTKQCCKRYIISSKYCINIIFLKSFQKGTPIAMANTHIAQQ